MSSILEANGQLGLGVRAADRAAATRRAEAKQIAQSSYASEQIGQVFHSHLLSAKPATRASEARKTSG